MEDIRVNSLCGHNADTGMKLGNLSEQTIKRLPSPAKGNSITYFAGAIIQGRKLHAVSESASQHLGLALSS